MMMAIIVSIFPCAKITPFSSPEHIVLMVSYCYTVMSVVSPSVRKMTSPKPLGLAVDVTGIKLFQSCSKN